MSDQDDAEFKRELETALGSDYKLGEMIGEGGFGRVYAATDVRLGRNVAIKVIRPDLAGARAFVERFRKEGTALAKFRHPGIVPIYDIREKGALIYYIMPLIEGETLRAQLERRRALSPKETQRILIELCDCLGATHRAGIVHRDIKPDNVILEGLFGTALLMDFGIAKALGDASSTASGAMMGTPTYMAPEQASGAEYIDQRADIYSLGVLAFHMLTGRPPFVGSSAHSVIAGHVMEKPTPVRKLNPSVPKSMADAIDRCLEKDPALRPQTTTALAERLRQVVFGIESVVESHRPGNYAMPFFAGLALAFEFLATLGASSVSALSQRELWYFAGGFAALAILTSPLARAATEPLSEQLRDGVSRFLQRFRRPRLSA